MKLLSPTVLLIALALCLPLQAVVISGRVVDRLGAAVPGATVVEETTWQTVNASDSGVFHLDAPGFPLTLRVSAPSGQSVSFEVRDEPADALRVELPVYAREALELDALVVLPSRFPVGDMPGAQMRSVEALLTPGSLADISRALQTLPGVDAQDEGDALYVRGGDAFETGIFVNGARYEQIRDEETPLGTFVGSVSPFLAEKIRFEAGGFGASRGNLLSAVVDVETVGAPSVFGGTLNVGLGAWSLGLDIPQAAGTGLRLTATRRDTAPIFKLNGSSNSFVQEPNGHDLSLLQAYSPNPYNTVKIFAIEQTNALAVRVTRAGQDDVYANDHRRRQGWASWEHEGGVWQGRLDASWSEMEKTESTGVWSWNDRTRGVQVLGRATRRAGERAQVCTGFEYERRQALLEERYLAWFHDDRVGSERAAAWGEVDWMLTGRWRAVTGWRADYANAGGGLTSDPRMATGYRIAKGLDLGASWGVYHQRPELVALSKLRSGGDFASQRATHAIVSLAWQSGDWQARLEAYEKNYRDLVLIDDNRRALQGEGRAKGLELSGRVPLPGLWKGRFSIGVSDAVRTEPRSGTTAPYGIPFTSAFILQREFTGGYQLGLTWRQASGRRYTPVLGGDYNASTGQWEPVYGTPNGAALRPLQRLDLLLTRIRELNTRLSLVTYLSVSNVLGRANVYDMAYGPDYREQEPVRSILNRIVYVGFSLNFR